MGCQSTLLRLVEDWRNALDNRQYAAAIMMDLSKAFDCLPHGLLLGKLRAYGLSVKACALVSSYLRPCSHHTFGTGTVPERNRAPVFTPVPLRPVVPERADHLAM